MLRCRAVQKNLTAWIDGELSPGGSNRIERHLAACPTCAGEAEGLRAAIDWQRRVLPVAVALGDIHPERLEVRLRHAIASNDVDDSLVTRLRASWLLRPLAVAGAALAVGVILSLWAGGPSMVLMPLGVEPPPVAVRQETELFKDYPLIQHLDAFEHFDTVESVPLDDDQASHKG